MTSSRKQPHGQMFDTLDEVRNDVANCLREGACDRRSAFHTLAVATADADVRIMVLRHYEAIGHVLRFHTDARAPKVAAIECDPRVTVLGYDRASKLQLRLHGSGVIERAGPSADAAWAESTGFARRCYLGEAPGVASSGPSSGLPAEFEGIEPSEIELLPARANFAVLLVRVETIDWFSLAHTGHRRALLTEDGGHWITP